jgi:methylated-DNA-[protein]-cysteine S-methyltransferase
MTVFCAVIPSPLGDLYCQADDSAVLEIQYTAGLFCSDGINHPVLLQLRNELDSYFSGKLKQFTVPIKLSGTAHRLMVWDELKNIPYGKTVTYRDVAQNVGSAPIAVGQAVGANRVNILIPCHRVVGSDGSLTGYGGGLERKRILLALESGAPI